MLKSIHYISSHTQWKSKSKLGSKPQAAQNTVLRLWIELTKSVTIYGNVTLTWFKEIFEEYYISKGRSKLTPTC